MPISLPRGRAIFERMLMKVYSDNLLYEKTFTVEVPPQKAFAALSESEELIFWFAEFSTATPRPGGSYNFWGRHTLWGEKAVPTNQHFTRFEPPFHMSYHWELKGMPTQVHFDIAKVDEGCRVTVRHETLEGAPDDYFRHMVGDFWRISMLNLLWYLETGGIMTRLDYTDTRGDVIIDFPLKAPASQIFQALTLPAKMDAWLSQCAKVELRVGGSYSFGWTEEVDGTLMPAGPTILTELELDKKLSYGWHWPGQEPDTRVIWDLQSVERRTMIRLSHLGFSPSRDCTDYKQGWLSFLCQLKLYLERGTRWKD
jgi:uncharacterized protein YndB with AHSA1/START domain